MKRQQTLVAIVILIAWGLIFGFPESDDTTQSDNTKQTINNNSNISATENTSAYDDKQLIQSFKQKRSKVWMEISMEVTRLLADDKSQRAAVVIPCWYHTTSTLPTVFQCHAVTKSPCVVATNGLIVVAYYTGRTMTHAAG